MSSRAPVAYPPEIHVLRDLRIWTGTSESGEETGLGLVPEMCGAAGTVRAGVLATLVDVAGGRAAVAAVWPDWIATSELVLHVLAPLRAGPGEAEADGEVVARPVLLRRTRSTVVLEVGLWLGAREVGLATMTFAVLPAREERPKPPPAEPGRTSMAGPDSRLRAPLAELLEPRLVDAEAGVLEVPKAPYVVNSHDAIQGGVLGVVAELAAHEAGAARLGGPVDTLDLSLNYLGQVRVGPARTSTRVLRADARAALLRVEIRDPGNEDRLCTVATVEVAAV